MDKSTFSLDRYLDRIHFRGQAKATLGTVIRLMRCQLMSIPFENLDVQAKKIVSINPNDIVDKLVNRKRGGYCYEVNGLFSLALDALSIPHYFVAARPILHGIRQLKTHMAIIVQLEGKNWLCDLGYGGYGIRAPLRLDQLETPIHQDDDAFMLHKESEQECVLKVHTSHGWEEQYAFELTPQKWEDFSSANLYNSTNPDSIFVKKLLVVMCTEHGRKILFGNNYKELEHGREEKRHLTPETRAVVLREEFGLVE